jgi:hypothetical protein
MYVKNVYDISFVKTICFAYKFVVLRVVLTEKLHVFTFYKLSLLKNS